MKTLALLLLIGCAGKAPLPDRSFVIFHTGDIHGQIDRLPRLASWLKAERAREKSARVVLVDSGDFFQGTPEGDLTRGRIVIEIMNAMGYDAACLGNHDFDQGREAVRDLAGRARFPLLAANLTSKLGGVRASTQIDGIEILGVGDGDEFTGAFKAVKSHGWSLPTRLLLTHLGIELDRKIPRTGIEAVLGGHSHSVAAERIGGTTWLLHSGSHGTRVGRLDLTLDGETGRVRASSAAVHEIPAGDEDEGILKMVRGAAIKGFDQRIATLAKDLPRAGPDGEDASSPIGNHVCDVLRESSGADLAIHMKSGIRSALFKGPITLRHLYEVSPFADTLATVRLTGKQLTEFIESVVAGRQNLEISGFEVTYNPKARRGHRIGTMLDPRRTYTVATTSFIADRLEGTVTTTDRRIFEVHRAYLEAHTPFSPEYKNRIIRR